MEQPQKSIIVSVPYTTPDGAERKLRFSHFVKDEIGLRYGLGKNLFDIMAEKGQGVIVEIAYLMMHDEELRPPPDLTLNRLRGTLSPHGFQELFGAVSSAFSNGEISKNDGETLFQELQKSAKEALMMKLPPEIRKLIDSGSGASAGSASDSQSESSGGVPRKKSKRASTATESNSVTAQP